MKNKLCYVSLFFCISCALAVAADDLKDVLASVRQVYSTMIPFYQKLYDCTPYSTHIDDMNYKIFGKENSKCHVTIGSYNCYFPLDIAKQYSTISEKDARQKIDQIDSRQSFYASTEEKSSKMINNFHNQYCRTEWEY